REFSHTDLIWYEGLKDWAALSAISAFSLKRIPPPVRTVDRGGIATLTEFAGFWRRLIALLIDWLILIVPAYAIGYVFGMAIFYGGTTSKSDLEAIGNVLGIIIAWLYFASMESSPLQATVGKLAIGIKVT